MSAPFSSGVRERSVEPMCVRRLVIIGHTSSSFAGPASALTCRIRPFIAAAR